MIEQLVKMPFTRAFQYRSATKKLYEERLIRAWPELDVNTKAFDLSLLPFQPLNLQAADLSALFARCEIDHAIGPVVDTVGSSDAGYRRWNEFASNRLGSYARQRNNALIDGVSRMSAYLHYGMVSPFRIARQAAQFDHAGSEKYFDELLIWRELAYSFCFHRGDLSATPENVPVYDWQIEELDRKKSNQLNHTAKGLTWEEIQRRVRSRYGR